MIQICDSSETIWSIGENRQMILYINSTPHWKRIIKGKEWFKIQYSIANPLRSSNKGVNFKLRNVKALRLGVFKLNSFSNTISVKKKNLIN